MRSRLFWVYGRRVFLGLGRFFGGFFIFSCLNKCSKCYL